MMGQLMCFCVCGQGISPDKTVGGDEVSRLQR